MLWVGIGVAVLALVVLGILGYGVLGAGARLQQELDAVEREIRPVLEQVQAAVAAQERRGAGASQTG